MGTQGFVMNSVFYLLFYAAVYHLGGRGGKEFKDFPN